MRGSVVDAKSLSSALPLKRNQPAVPAATPTMLQTPDLVTAPSAAALNVRPLVAVPGVNAPELSVTVPSSVPVAAASADAGCVPVRTSMMPLAKIDEKPAVLQSALRVPVESRIVKVDSP